MNERMKMQLQITNDEETRKQTNTKYKQTKTKYHSLKKTYNTHTLIHPISMY